MYYIYYQDRRDSLVYEHKPMLIIEAMQRMIDILLENGCTIVGIRVHLVDW